MNEEKKVNLEEAFDNILQDTSGVGDEELIRIATQYTRQISGYQLKLILFLKYISFEYQDEERDRINSFIETWLELKQYNNSSQFVRGIVDSIALKRLMTENSIKVNIEK